MLAGFLAVTVCAASRLAAVTAEVLSDLETIDTTVQTGLDRQQATARFVAAVMTPGLVDRVELQDRVQAVLQEEALDMLVQPIVDLRTGRMVACEALSRFRSPLNEPPDWWFSAAQQVGLGVELELLALRRALALLARVPQPLRLTLELTEHDAVADYERLLTVLHQLRDQGMRLAVDDAGSGYSGLTQILHLQPHVIRLDRVMVAGLPNDPVRRAMATALATFGGEIGVEVIAEGVEEQAEADCLLQLGITHVQGFLYWPPLSIEALITAQAGEAPPPPRRREPADAA